MEVRYSKSARKALLRSNKRKLIWANIEELAAEPERENANVVRMVGVPESRLRVQDWRVIFHVEGSILWIDHIGPRGSVYEGGRR